MNWKGIAQKKKICLKSNYQRVREREIEKEKEREKKDGELNCWSTVSKRSDGALIDEASYQKRFEWSTCWLEQITIWINDFVKNVSFLVKPISCKLIKVIWALQSRLTLLMKSNPFFCKRSIIAGLLNLVIKANVLAFDLNFFSSKEYLANILCYSNDVRSLQTSLCSFFCCNYCCWWSCCCWDDYRCWQSMRLANLIRLVMLLTWSHSK